MSFQDDDDQESPKQYHLPSVEIKDYNVMIDGRIFLDQTIKNNLKSYNNIRMIATGQGDDYPTGYLLDYLYFKKYFKLLALHLSKQQKLDADPKAIQQINVTGNLSRAEGATMFFIIKTVKVLDLDFSFRFFKRKS